MVELALREERVDVAFEYVHHTCGTVSSNVPKFAWLAAMCAPEKAMHVDSKLNGHSHTA